MGQVFVWGGVGDVRGSCGAAALPSPTHPLSPPHQTLPNHLAGLLWGMSEGAAAALLLRSPTDPLTDPPLSGLLKGMSEGAAAALRARFLAEVAALFPAKRRARGGGGKAGGGGGAAGGEAGCLGGWLGKEGSWRACCVARPLQT